MMMMDIDAIMRGDGGNGGNGGNGGGRTLFDEFLDGDDNAHNNAHNNTPPSPSPQQQRMLASAPSSSSSSSIHPALVPSSASAANNNNNNNNDLIPITRLPIEHQSIFAGYTNFNRVQSCVFTDAYESDVNLVIASPTGSGKTAIFELAMLRMFKRERGATKAVYIAPIRALCQERYDDWRAKFGRTGVKCTLVTGDTPDVTMAGLRDTNIICCTPEKWDSMTRKWKQYRAFMDTIGLLLIDEVHLLNESRGAVLEGIVSRCKLMRAYKQQDQQPPSSSSSSVPASRMRMLALSATIPNTDDLARWLKGRAHSFGAEHRPVPLTWQVKGYRQADGQNAFLFNRNLDFDLHNIVHEYSAGRPTLVFCNTKKGCTTAAKQLLESAGRAGTYIRDTAHRSRLATAARRIGDQQLSTLVLSAVAVHTAGVSYADRIVVEAAFRAGDIMVMCATSTLAQGVNLPAHLVVIKGTERYVQGDGYSEYPRSELLQMVGRAGRPQYDTSGTVVIMTKSQDTTRYWNVGNAADKVESQLAENAWEHLNAEVALRMVTNVSEAVMWIKNSFYYVRARHEPQQYGIVVGDNDGDDDGAVVDAFMRQLVLKGLTYLSTYHFITYDDDAYSFTATALSELASAYYLRLDTVQLIATIQPDMEMMDILNVLCQAREFDGVRLRMGDKKVLNGFNKGGKKDSGGALRYPKIRFPIKGGVKELFHKVSVLVQVRFDGHQSQLNSVMLENDVTTIFRVAERVARAICKHVSSMPDGFTARHEAKLLNKALVARLWPDSTVPVAQIANVGIVRARKLTMAGIGTLGAVETHSARSIGDALSRKAPFGKNVKSAVRRFPKWSVVMAKEGSGDSGGDGGDGSVRITVTQTRDGLDLSDKPWVQVLVGDQANHVLLDRRMCVTVSQFVYSTVIRVPATSHRLRAKVLNDTIIGLDVAATFVVTDVSPSQQQQHIDDGGNSVLVGQGAASPAVGSSSSSSSSSSRVEQTCAHDGPKCMQRLCRHQCCQRSGLPSVLVGRPKSKTTTKKRAAAGDSGGSGGGGGGQGVVKKAAVILAPPPPTTIDMIQAFRVQSNLPNRVKRLRAAPTVMSLPSALPPRPRPRAPPPPPLPPPPPAAAMAAAAAAGVGMAVSSVAAPSSAHVYTNLPRKKVSFSFSDVYADLFK